ncbi:Uma2 family endonuclease [Streptomyces sp. NPDC051940]|uniref:Uma2 family endonuclease n=1 Tax=Streptomyces sp. NPDC051940 TaxID=3155675 RepID=UPI00342B38E3
MGEDLSAAPVPEWLVPPAGGFTADDLDRLSGLPPHTELIDGSLVFASPQTFFHMLVGDFLLFALRAQAPQGFAMVRRMTVTLGRRNRPEPDLMVLKADARSLDAEATTYRPEDVALAVEVASAESEDRDREVKPDKYAQAGIPHFWRVEKDQGLRPVVYVYELDPATSTYALMKIACDNLATPGPFPIDIDLTAIDTF